jgi:rhodanese-related sulfurtransferase
MNTPLGAKAIDIRLGHKIFMPTKDLAKGTLFILGLATMAAFAVNAVSPNGIALLGDWDPSRGVITARAKGEIVDHELEIEDIRRAKAIYDQGDALFVDARPYDRYRQGHIKGAVGLPVHRFLDVIDDFRDQYPLTTWIVTYCSGRECDESHELAQYLLEEGYQRVSVFIDGYSGWEEMAFPVERARVADHS